MKRPWTLSEDEYIIKQQGVMSDKKIARTIDRTRRAVWSRRGVLKHPDRVKTMARLLESASYGLVGTGGMAKTFSSLSELNKTIESDPGLLDGTTPVKLLKIVRLVEVSE